MSDFRPAAARRRLALLAGAALAAIASPALAQQSEAASQPATTSATQPETVVVRGARPLAESERAALQVQRNSVNLVSVVSADEAGRLADQNIAFAVGRLPGVALERDQGQARYVNLRGQPRRWTNISIDGLNIVSPEGRDTRFDNIPSAIASQVTVAKAITPDMPGDTVSGNINIRTRSAFDYRGRAIRGSVQLGEVTLGGGREIDASLVVADRFFDGNLGILAQASFYEREMVTDNWETDPWLRPGGVLQGATGPSGIDRRPGSETRSWAREHENKLYRLTRGNISGSLRADWQLGEGGRVFAQTVYTQFTDNELRNNYIFRFDNGAANTSTAACTSFSTPVTGGNGANDICNGNTPQRGVVYGARLQSNFRTASIKEYTWSSTLGGDHDDLFGFTFSWRLNYTKTEDGQDDAAQPFFQSPTDPLQRPSVLYNFTDPYNHGVELYRTVLTGTGTSAVRSLGTRVFEVEQFAQSFLNIDAVTGGATTEAVTFRADAERSIQLFGLDADLKFGVLYTNREKTNDPITWSASAADLTAAGRPQFSMSTVALDGPFKGRQVLGYTFRYYSEGALLGYMADLINSGVAKRQTATEQQAFYAVTEEITAGYAMATVRPSWGSVVFGVRVEQTTNTGQGFSPLAPILLTTESDETRAYPSLHVNWDLNDEMKLRFGITTGASRPDFDEIAPNFSVDDGPQLISGGNPDAKPEEAVGLDVYWEWYRADQGYMSVGVFHKDLSSVLFTQTGIFGLDVLDSPTIDRSGYTFSTLRNGGSGRITGVEFTWNQLIEDWVKAAGGPEWMEGFGWRFTATVTDSEMTIPAFETAPTRVTDLTGASDMVANFAITYEKYGLSVRLAYQVRTDWLQSVGGYATVNGAVVPNGNGDVYWLKDDELDLSVRYQLTDNIELTFDAVNLLDTPAMRYADSFARPIEWETFGARYLVGARFKY